MAAYPRYVIQKPEVLALSLKKTSLRKKVVLVRLIGKKRVSAQSIVGYGKGKGSAKASERIIPSRGISYDDPLFSFSAKLIRA
jgi:hypothetical protein